MPSPAFKALKSEAWAALLALRLQQPGVRVHLGLLRRALPQPWLRTRPPPAAGAAPPPRVRPPPACRRRAWAV